jgi:hypothetical protein
MKNIDTTGLHAIELLANCYVIVTQDVMDTIEMKLRSPAAIDGKVIIKGKDYEGYDFGFSSDSVVIWHNDSEAIEELVAK